MKFSIIFRQFGEGRNCEVRNVATVSRRDDAAALALGLARVHRHEKSGVYVQIFGEAGSEWEVCIYPHHEPPTWDDYLSLLDQITALAGRWKKRKAEQRRQQAFRDKFRPSIHADTSGWMAANEIMQDGVFSRAVWAEDYAAAETRAAEIGLQPVQAPQ